ncbi:MULTISPECIES: archease [Nostoc]|uniref:Archease n=1 Tax=Nostoc paludosum FACHB-159 TaxID=2692908 RepID=A0ABR8K7X1_9NOSO|nr:MULTISPECIES: archease [Nostoc]MBD2677395.1 archease [Nostoc sp. FACHB-857]MBD2734212.1 archease [Nostoc paludosum FACHB-159]
MKSADLINLAGFQEVEHTADWAYRVWGRNLTELFIQAAIALYYLADVELTSESSITRKIQLQGVDYVSLLVAWLNELLYLHESENLAFNQFKILHLDAQSLEAEVTGTYVQNWQKFIKAVTYHNLSIQETEKGLEATLVLDV